MATQTTKVAVVMPTRAMSREQLRHKLNVAHASGRLQPNGRARLAAGRWRGNRSATRHRDIADRL